MDRQVAEELVRASEVHCPDGCGPLELRESYSGRGMNGRETVAVAGEMRTFFAAISQAAQTSDDPDEITDAVGRVRMDSLGKDDTIFY